MSIVAEFLKFTVFLFGGVIVYESLLHLFKLRKTTISNCFKRNSNILPKNGLNKIKDTLKKRNNFNLRAPSSAVVCTALLSSVKQGINIKKYLLILKIIIYGLLPIDLFPRLTEETKVIWTYLLLGDKMMKVEPQTTAGSDRIRSLYSPGNRSMGNSPYIIIIYLKVSY